MTHWLFVLPLGLHLAWYVLQLLTLKRLTKLDGRSDTQALSLIIAGKNEAENLLENLPLWIAQSHSNFEIVIVNDRSIDHTKHVLEAFKQKTQNLKIVTIEEYPGTIIYGKKHALTMGIKSATHSNLVFTDADCIPNDAQFLQRFDYQFANGKNLILGLGGFQRKITCVNLFYRIENARIALNYFTMAWLKMPFMAVGRSFGYSKELFFENNGFKGHRTLASGDDDLFVQQASKKANIGLIPKAATISQTPESFAHWLKQKKRHNSTSKHYSIQSLLLIFFIELIPILSLATIPFLIVFNPDISVWGAVLLLILMRLVCYQILMRNTLKLVNANKSEHFIFMLEPFLCAWNNLFSSLTLLTRPSEWKRKI